jgi:hypothetical protein
VKCRIATVHSVSSFNIKTKYGIFIHINGQFSFTEVKWGGARLKDRVGHQVPLPSSCQQGSTPYPNVIFDSYTSLKNMIASQSHIHNSLMGGILEPAAVTCSVGFLMHSRHVRIIP